VIYVSNEGGQQRAWIVPIEGGKSNVVANVFAYYPVVSPDGKSLAFVTVNEQTRPLLAVCALSDCATRRTGMWCCFAALHATEFAFYARASRRGLSSSPTTSTPSLPQSKLRRVECACALNLNNATSCCPPLPRLR